MAIARSSPRFVSTLSLNFNRRKDLWHIKGQSSSKNGRESQSKRLGLKKFGGEVVKAGNIIVRQRGTVHNADKNVGMGKDHTLYALVDGTVVFTRKRENKSYVSVVPFEN